MKKNNMKLICILSLLLVGVLCVGCGKKIYYDVNPNQAEHQVKEPDSSQATTGGADITGVEVTITPEPTPDVSQIDTTKIISVYKPDIDTTGLPVIDQNSLGETGDIEYLKGVTEKGAVIEIINGTTFVNGLLMVNKTYTLPAYFVPSNTHANVVGEDFVVEGITKEAWDAWVELQQGAMAASMNVYIASSYRSYAKQADVFKNYTEWHGKEQADTFSARAGHSEHQTGLCIDLNSVTDEFGNTAEGKWINDNCWKYGYCIRFPKGKDEITGYKYESWHIRYVGKELAEILYNNGDWLSMEDVFGLESHYMD